jgi:hypothetical protein
MALFDAWVFQRSRDNDQNQAEEAPREVAKPGGYPPVTEAGTSKRCVLL